MGENNALISKLNKFSDVMLALGVVMIVMMMIIPCRRFCSICCWLSISHCR